MNKTRIEWADYTWNPITGCLGPKGDGVRCPYCYANRLANGRLRERYLQSYELIAGDPHDPFAPRFQGGLLDPVGKKAGRIFVGSMTDPFGDWMPSKWIEWVLTTVHCCPQHTFMFLTKWPQNLARWSPWPENCWVGATATNNTEAYDAIKRLDDVDAIVRYLSIEPLLANIGGKLLDGLDWVIIGAQTGPGAKPIDTRDVRELLDAADYYGIPVFLKDNLHWSERRQEWPASPSGERTT
jgi:protein gp37